MRIRVGGVIIKDGKILLIHRFKNGQEYFVFPGGGVQEGEDLEKALKREIKEETNLDVESAKLFLELNESDPQYYFLIEKFSGTAELLASSEEGQRMVENNQYYLVWRDLAAIKDLNNLYPEAVKNKIVELYGGN